jgi:hypothetical protein
MTDLLPLMDGATPTVAVSRPGAPARELGRGRIAAGFASRLRGLLGAPAAPAGGLLISNASSIHMLGMGFPIDAVHLGAAERFADGELGLPVLRVARGLRPWTGLSSARGGAHVLELPVGGAVDIAPGDRILLR